MLQLITTKRVLLTAALCCLTGLGSFVNAQAPVDLLAKVRAEGAALKALNTEREARFRKAMEDQRRLNAEAQAKRNTADARTKQLDASFAANEAKIKELNELLTISQGNLGELFGVTRQVAGDALGMLSSSLANSQAVTTIYSEDRIDFMRRLSASSELPNIVDLERMWFELLREMKTQGEVVRYKTPVLQADGVTKTDMDVVRVGIFTAYGDTNKYLAYLPSQKLLAILGRQPLEREYQNLAKQVLSNTSGAGYMDAVVDPTLGGALMSMWVERPDFWERIQKGEVVGYLIIAVGVMGVLLAAFQYIYLFIAKIGVSGQLKKITAPMGNNALGRMLLAVKDSGEESPEVVELRISEAVLREIPRLERFQAFLRLAVAAGPLLGLIGTVIGMIVTFQSITASGTSDPKLMAQGIGQAMIATVLGLGIAIPLLFINAGLVSLSKSVIHVLEEESTSLMARILNKAH